MAKWDVASQKVQVKLSLLNDLFLKIHRLYFVYLK
jgi:hypothetical protein